MVTLIVFSAIALLAVALVCFALLQAACEHLDNVEARRHRHRRAA
jgi:hypothetical protein